MRFLAFLFFTFVAILVWSFTAKADECHRPSDTIAMLEPFTKQHGQGAIATYVDLPGENGMLGVLIVVFTDAPDMASMEMYQKGCRIINPTSGEPRTPLKLDAKIKAMIEETGAVLFDNRSSYLGKPS